MDIEREGSLDRLIGDFGLRPTPSRGAKHSPEPAGAGPRMPQRIPRRPTTCVTKDQVRVRTASGQAKYLETFLLRHPPALTGFFPIPFDLDLDGGAQAQPLREGLIRQFGMETIVEWGIEI